MEKIYNKNLKISIISAILIMVVLIGVLFTTNPHKAFAANETTTEYYVGYSSDRLSEETLYNLTNTYNYKGLGADNSYYNVSKNGKNNEKVSSTGPQITVLTHGLGGAANNWSNIINNGFPKFAYDKKSLISKLDELVIKNTGNEANIYWAKMIKSSDASSREFELIDLKQKENINCDKSYKSSDNATKSDVISDISKHIIIVFEASDSGASNNFVYEEFNHMLSKIIYDVKFLNGGFLPKVNLIGHSRGGITNLQYYMDHPELVEQIYSLGTPYFGSNTASTELGKKFCASALDGLHDVIDRDVYNGYFYRLINNPEVYNNFNVHALGGYSQSDFLFDQLIADDDVVEKFISDDKLIFIKGAVRSTPGFVSSAGDLAKLINQVLSLFRDEGYEEEKWESWIQIVSNIQYIDSNSSFWDNFINLIPIIGTPYFMSDVLVPLDSQLGVDSNTSISKEYVFHRYTKCFDKDNCDTTKISMANMPAVVHNLEARDSDFIEYICDNISLDRNLNGAFKTEICQDGTVSIVDYLADINEKVFIIPSVLNNKTVTKISNGAFANKFNENVEEVIIPNTITIIDDNAFKNCSVIERFSIGNSVQTIGESAFENCSNLIEVYIPSSVTLLGHKAFKDCSRLEYITISNNVSSIGDYAFENCIKLNNILLPKGLNDLGEGAFKDCKSFTNVEIPFNITTISDNLFDGCENLEHVKIPNNVKIIGNYAFNDCYNISNFDIPANVNFLGDYAFSNCKKISALNVPKNTTYLGDGVFNGCSNLTSFSVPTSITSIGRNAFKGCELITNITIPSKVTFIGDEAFKDCYKLKVVMLPNNISYIGDSAFENCISIESITMKPHISYLGEYAFKGCIAMKNISLPNSISTLNNGTFSGCSSLSAVTIQNSTILIKDNVFEYCVSLKNVTIPGDVTSIGNYAFLGCVNLVTVSSQNDIVSIGDGAFKDCVKLKSISISKNATHLGDYIFYGCTSLTKIVIPKSVKYVGENAFYNCSKLTIEIEEQENVSMWNKNWNSTHCLVIYK